MYKNFSGLGVILDQMNGLPEKKLRFLACSYGKMNIDPHVPMEDYQDYFNEFRDFRGCQNKYISAIQFCIDRGFMTGREHRIEPKALLTMAKAVMLINKRQRH